MVKSLPNDFILWAFIYEYLNYEQNEKLQAYNS